MIEYKENITPLAVRLLLFAIIIIFSIYFAIIYNKNGLFFVAILFTFFLITTAYFQVLVIHNDRIVYKKKNIILRIAKEQSYLYEDISFLKINTSRWGIIDIFTGIWPFSEMNIIFNISEKIINLKMYLNYKKQKECQEKLLYNFNKFKNQYLEVK